MKCPMAWSIVCSIEGELDDPSEAAGRDERTDTGANHLVIAT